MHTTGNSVRAVALAALMVLSTFVGAIAFAGAGAAAAGDGTATLTVADTTPDASTDHSWTHEILAPEGGADVQVLRMNYTGTGVDLSNVGGGDLNATYVNETTGSTDLVGLVSDVSTSNDGEVLTITLNSQVTVYDGDTVTVETTSGEVVNPGVGTYTGEFAAYATANATTVVNSDTDTFEIARAGGDVEATEDGATVFQGQQVVYDAVGDADNTNPNQDTYELRRETGDDDSTFETALNVENGYVNVSTDDLAPGENYFITNNPDDSSDFGFEVTEQDLSAEFNETSVTAGAPGDVELTLESNRRSYDVAITSEELGDNETAWDIVFPGSDASDLNDDDEYVVPVTSTEQVWTLGFTEAVETGQYNFTFEAVDTTASATASLNVSSQAEGGIGFERSVFEEQRGDIANITVNTENIERGYLTVGSIDAGYVANMSVTDGDDDGEVVVRMNTFLATRETTADGNPNAAFSVADDEDSVTVADAKSATSDLLPSEAYDLQASRTLADDGSYGFEADAVATLSVGERSATEIRNWRAPSNADLPTSVSDVLAGVNDTVTETDTIAEGDLLVQQITASGLTGAIEAQAGGSTTTRFVNLFTDSEFAELSFEGPQDTEFDMSQAIEGVVVDGTNDTHYVVVSTDDPVIVDADGDTENFAGNAYEFRTDATYTSNVTLFESDLTGVDEEASLTDDVMVTERTATIDNADNLTLPASANATLSGTTSIAPGSTVNVRLRSEDSNSPFLRSAPGTEVMAGPDAATFMATFDLSGVPAGTNFTATVSGGNFEDNPTASGQVTGAMDGGNATTTTTTTGNETTTTTGTETTTETTTTTADGETTTADGEMTTAGNDTNTTTGNGGVPGFGIAVALLALFAAGVLGLRAER